MTIDHYHTYCEREYFFVKNCIANKNSFGIYSPEEIRDNAIQRLLGAGYLAQQMDASYEEVEQEFEYYKEKIKEICETS